jgi:hypothetical protein
LCVTGSAAKGGAGAVDRRKVALKLVSETQVVAPAVAYLGFKVISALNQTGEQVERGSSKTGITRVAATETNLGRF